MGEHFSKQSKFDKILIKIAGPADAETRLAHPGTGLADPGDVVFGITHYPYKPLKDICDGKGWRETIRLRMRPWRGFALEDLDEWHVGIYIVGRKRKSHKRINCWAIHSTIEKGVHIQHVTPGILINKDANVRTRLEILRFEGISKEQRKTIVDFAGSKVGCEFDRAGGKFLTYMLGLPNVYRKKDQFECQQLVIEAYAAAGIYFPHPYRSFPAFNIGRYLGHPLGHPRDRVDPRYPYLMDHHIYRDPRFVLKAAILQDPETREIVLQTENLKKYSWNEELRERYIKRKYLDPGITNPR